MSQITLARHTRLALLLLAAGCAAPRQAATPAADHGAMTGEADRAAHHSEMDHAAMDHSDHAAMDGMSTDPSPDVRFMQDMIPHHAQAIDMAALVDGRGASRAVTLVAERIRVSQADEIRRMSRWLAVRDKPVPASHSGHLMAGMLTPEQMAALAAATGADFDRLFLTGMIQHHRGALTMVDQILDARGGAQASDVYQLVSDIEADQTTEISRMQSLLTQP